MVQPLSQFSGAAQRALATAADEAARRHHSYIGPEHLLAALINDEQSVAGVILAQLGGREKLRLRVDSLLSAMQPLGRGGQAPAPPVKRVITLSVEQAQGEGQRVTGTGHLLLGFLLANEGSCAQALHDAGIELTTVRERLRDVSTSDESDVGT